MSSSVSSDSINIDNWALLLRAAAMKVFSMMVNYELTTPVQVNPPIVAEVTAMVGFVGELCGVLSIKCGALTATKVASNMLGLTEENAAIQGGDAMGEVCNMVAGNFKASVQGLEDQCLLSAPTIITGDSYLTHSLVSGSRIEFALMFGDDPVWFTLEARTQS